MLVDGGGPRHCSLEGGRARDMEREVLNLLPVCEARLTELVVFQHGQKSTVVTSSKDESNVGEQLWSLHVVDERFEGGQGASWGRWNEQALIA
jgi:hypothetical protein